MPLTAVAHAPNQIVRDAVGIGVAVGVYGVSFGVLAVGAGLTPAQACVMSMLTFTGASQFAFIGVIGASAIIGVLVVLSAILTATTLFPSINVTLLSGILFGALAVGLAAAGLYVGRGRNRAVAATAREAIRRDRWTMPPLELLDRPAWSRARTIGMYTLRGYLLIAVLMLIVKAVEVSLGH